MKKNLNYAHDITITLDWPFKYWFFSLQRYHLSFDDSESIGNEYDWRIEPNKKAIQKDFPNWQKMLFPDEVLKEGRKARQYLRDHKKELYNQVQMQLTLSQKQEVHWNW